MNKRVLYKKTWFGLASLQRVLGGAAAAIVLLFAAHTASAQLDTSQQQLQQQPQQPQQQQQSPYGILAPSLQDDNTQMNNGTSTQQQPSLDTMDGSTQNPAQQSVPSSIGVPPSTGFDIETDAQGYPINTNQTNGYPANGNQNYGYPANGNQNSGYPGNGTQTNGAQTNGNQTNGTQTNGNQTYGNQNNGSQNYDNQNNGSENYDNQNNDNQNNGYPANGNQNNGNPANGNQANGPAGSRNGQRGNVQGNAQTQRQNRPSNAPNAQNFPERNQGPEQLHVYSPYRNLPSLEDLYTEVPSRSVRPQRFGSRAFVFGTGNTDELPADLPAGPDYVLGPGDGILVNMWGGRSGRMNLIIDRQGQISLPEVGTVTLNGLTLAQAQTEVQRVLNTQFQNEHVDIAVGRVRTVQVYVVGDVQVPGAYDVSSLSTALNALYQAGGPTSRGSLRVLKQMRGNREVAQIDLYDFLLKGVRPSAERLQPGDTILVPPVGPQVTVEGSVRRPAIYELNGETTLDQMLDLAGGVLPSANLQQISVERVVSHERHVMLNLQITGDNAAEVQKQLSAFHVQADDDIIIAQILPYNQQAVYLAGHVFRPGRYPYRAGMTLNDLLRSYQDVLPEPSEHAEIIRLRAPDYRPESIAFNLPDALIGNNPIPLQPFDVVRVFSRYEVDPPRVTVEGEVLRPGHYPMSEGMTVSDLVRLAGGFLRSAYQDEADLTSYVVQNGRQVVLSHQDVHLRKVLDGDKSADVVLKPGDMVSVRQLAGWRDIGSQVIVDGEVAHPGGYGLEQGEKLSSVLQRAGGFTANAYPEAAVLERMQVLVLAEQARQSMIDRLESTPIAVKPGPLTDTSDTTAIQQSLQQQRDQILASLRSHPASGRQVINITLDISKWKNTAADIELRAGDRIIIPKRPNFVMVTGQTYNATAITYIPGRRLEWYLRQAGGATTSGDKRRIYVLRANGSVAAVATAWHSDIMSLRMQPGDTIIVPEKLVGASEVLKNILSAAQIASSVAITGAVAGIF